MLEEGVAEGSLKVMDAQLTAQVIVAQAVGLLLQGLLDPDGADWPRVSQAAFEMIFSQLME
jgi:hypothetical protein